MSMLKSPTKSLRFVFGRLPSLVTAVAAAAELKASPCALHAWYQPTATQQAPTPEHSGCTNLTLQVQEEFAIGVMGEVNRARTAEKVAAGARDLGEKTASTVGKAASAVSHQVGDSRAAGHSQAKCAREVAELSVRSM